MVEGTKAQNKIVSKVKGDVPFVGKMALASAVLYWNGTKSDGITKGMGRVLP